MGILRSRVLNIVGVLLLLMMLLPAMLPFSGALADDLPYTLTLGNSGHGNVTVPGEGVFPEDVGNVTITATPDLHYHFTDWSGDVSTVADVNAANTTVDMGGNYTITANFAIDAYTLLYSAGANGSLTGNDSQYVPYGGNGTEVTAVPDPCYHFVQWDDNVMTASRTDTLVTGNIQVVASFAVDVYYVTYLEGDHGSVEGGCCSPQPVNCGGDGPSVMAWPDPGYHFGGWSDGNTTNPRQDTDVHGNLTVTASFVFNFPGGGNGTAGNPWHVGNQTDLEWINTDPSLLDDYYVMTNGITLTGDWTPIGLDGGSWTDEGEAPPADPYADCAGEYYTQPGFSGHFNGAGHIISGLHIDRSGNSCPDTYWLGLFGLVTGTASIGNLTLAGPYVDGGASDGEDVGALVGYVYADGGTLVIENCHVTGSAYINGSEEVGGLIGWAQSSGNTSEYHIYDCSVGAGADVMGSYYDVGGFLGGAEWYLGGGPFSPLIERCHTDALVSANNADYVGGFVGGSADVDYSQCYATGDVYGYEYGIGGFLGFGGYLNVDDCYARGDVVATNTTAASVGGMFGSIGLSDVHHCYSTGEVDVGLGSVNVGGFAGLSFADTYDKCVWDQTTSGWATDGTGTDADNVQPMASPAMQTWSQYSGRGWSGSIWGLVGTCNDGYPCLLLVTPLCGDYVPPPAPAPIPVWPSTAAWIGAVVLAGILALGLGRRMRRRDVAR